MITIKHLPLVCFRDYLCPDLGIAEAVEIEVGSSKQKLKYIGQGDDKICEFATKGFPDLQDCHGDVGEEGEAEHEQQADDVLLLL